jgi:hypothetical protein
VPAKKEAISTFDHCGDRPNVPVSIHPSLKAREPVSVVACIPMDRR